MDVPEDVPEETEPQAKSAKQETHTDLWQCFDEIMCKNSATDSNNSVLQKNSLGTEREFQIFANREVDSFLSLQPIPGIDCPFTWWADNKHLFPTLFKIAKKYLSAPCSSVYSEQLFSTAGNILEEKRSRLTPSKSEELLFLHHNLPRVKFDY